MDAKQHTVLVVDDQPTNLALLVAMLKEFYNVVQAVDGEEALSIVSQAPKPDIIMLDIMMPGMDGFDVCKALKKNPKTNEIPVVFITSLNSDKDRDRCFAAGGSDYISKPISKSEVLARVKAQLDARLKNRQLKKMVKKRTKALKRAKMLLERKSDLLKIRIRDALKRLGLAAQYRDHDTARHTERVAEFCWLIAKRLGLSKEECNLLRWAAPMHDIGKVGIPDSILLKPGGLTAVEWALMKDHTNIGAGILQPNPDDPDAALIAAAYEIARWHHEKWNGTGYPDGLQGEDIPIIARILALADVFDALTARRPYKEPWSVGEAVVEILRSRFTHFDPKVVWAFIDVLPKILQTKERLSD